MRAALINSRDERQLLRLAAIVGLVLGLVMVLGLRSCGHLRPKPSPEKVYRFISKVAAREDLDPGFVYALAFAESSLDPRARSSVARGMMQLTKPAWKEVSGRPYRHAWRWKANIRVAIDYLAFCRDRLESANAFSYPLLAACYRYGPYYVAGKNYSLAAVDPPENRIYQQLFAGNLRPLAPPE